MNQAANDRPIFVSTTSFETHDLNEILSLCVAHEIDALELSAVRKFELSQLGSTSFPRSFLVHNYFPPPERPFLLNLASQDKDNLDRSIEHCKRAIDLSADLGGSIYAAHGGFAVDLDASMLGKPDQQARLSENQFTDYEQVYRTLVDSVIKVNNYAKRKGVKFLIENNVLSIKGGIASRRLLPMVRADELVRLVNDVDDENFGLLADVGHANVSATALGFDREEFMEAILPHVVGFHLSDNDGVTDQNASFGANAWFMPFVKGKPGATITLELRDLSPQQIIRVKDEILGCL